MDRKISNSNCGESQMTADWTGTPQASSSESYMRNISSRQVVEEKESLATRSECSSEDIAADGDLREGRNEPGGSSFDVEGTLEDFKKLGRDLESNIMQLAKERIARRTQCTRARQEANLLGQKVEIQKKQTLEMKMKMELLGNQLLELQTENQRDVAQKFGYITDLFNSIGESGEHLKAKYLTLKDVVESFSKESSRVVMAIKHLSKESLTSGNQYITTIKEFTNYYLKNSATLFEEHKKLNSRVEHKLERYSQLLDAKRTNSMALAEARLKLNKLKEDTASAENIFEHSKCELENGKQQVGKMKAIYTENIVQMKNNLQGKQAELELFVYNGKYLESQLADELEKVNSLKENIASEEEILSSKCVEKSRSCQELENLNESIQGMRIKLETLTHEREALATVEMELERLKQEEADKIWMVDGARAESARMEEELRVMKLDEATKELDLKEKRNRLNEVQQENCRLREVEAGLKVKISEIKLLKQNIESEKLKELDLYHKQIEEEEAVNLEQEAYKSQLEALVAEQGERLNQLQNKINLLRKEIEASIQARINFEEKIDENESKHKRDLENIEYLLDDAQEEYLELLNSVEGMMSAEEAREKLSQTLEQKEAVDMCNEMQMKEINKSFEEQLSVLDRKLAEITKTSGEKLNSKLKIIAEMQESINNLGKKKISEEAKVDRNIPRLMKTISFGINQLEQLLDSYKESWDKTKEVPSPSVIQNCTRLEELLADPFNNMASRYGIKKRATSDPTLFSELLNKFQEEFDQVTTNVEKTRPKDINKTLIELGFCIYQKNESNFSEVTPHMSCGGPKLNDSYYSTVSAIDKLNK